MIGCLRQMTSATGFSTGKPACVGFHCCMHCHSACTVFSLAANRACMHEVVCVVLGAYVNTAAAPSSKLSVKQVMEGRRACSQAAIHASIHGECIFNQAHSGPRPAMPKNPSCIAHETHPACMSLLLLYSLLVALVVPVVDDVISSIHVTALHRIQ